jgi:hypothetical protein
MAHEQVQNQEGNKRSWDLLQTEESQRENKPESRGAEKGYEEKQLAEQNRLEQKRLRSRWWSRLTRFEQQEAKSHHKTERPPQI